MKFWETFSALCSREGTTPNAVAKELGISSGAITWWKKGKMPHKPTLEKIAIYFDVSVDYLLGYETTEGENKLLALFKQIPEEKQDFVIKLIKVALQGLE